MRGLGAAALILTGVMIVEGFPLASAGLQPGGAAWLGRLVGFGAPPISPLAWLLALMVALAYAASSMRSLPFIRAHLLDVAPIKLLAIPFALVTGVFEELFFRKWLMDAAAARGASILVQLIASAVVFGAVHGVWGLLGRNLRVAWRSALFTGGLGLALAVVYLVSGRQLAPAAWSHTLINLIIEPWLMLGVMQLRFSGARTVAPPTDVAERGRS